jgi:hypothetical protein
VNDPLNMHADVGILEPLDLLPAQVAMREEREGVARDLFQNRVVVPSGQGHRLYGREPNGRGVARVGCDPYLIHSSHLAATAEPLRPGMTRDEWP